MARGADALHELLAISLRQLRSLPCAATVPTDKKYTPSTNVIDSLAMASRLDWIMTSTAGITSVS
jgi:hypothetical protein